MGLNSTQIKANQESNKTHQKYLTGFLINDPENPNFTKNIESRTIPRSEIRIRNTYRLEIDDLRVRKSWCDGHSHLRFHDSWLLELVWIRFLAKRVLWVFFFLGLWDQEDQKRNMKDIIMKKAEEVSFYTRSLLWMGVRLFVKKPKIQL